jgi:D-alanine-D-alanine ligase
VLLGGLSAEREISLLSGRRAADALRAIGYRVTAVEVGRDLAARLARLRPDVAFNALHGRYGEDGCVQGVLELMRIPYTGAGVLGSAVAMNKALTKELWRAHGLPTPAWALVTRAASVPARGPRSPVRLPVVVKPNCEGSSVGVSIVHRARDLPRALRAARRFGDVLIEAYVPGREVTVGVLDGRALGALEVVAKGDEFHSYDVKYTPGREDFFMPARLGAATMRRVLALGEGAHAAVAAGAYSRVDLRVDGRRPFLIEINTLPGLTELSYLPRIAAHAGISYPRLCERILDRAALATEGTAR